jgi:hypothetical protein
MSTRGFITFAVDGANKTAYNHSDSYPDWLGVRILRWCQKINANPRELAAARRLAASLRVVSADSEPTAQDIARLREFSWGKSQHGGNADLREGQQWYDLLHETQGDPAAMLAAGVIEDASSFPGDSLFAEWGYVIDFDNDGQLEAYEGFQKSPHKSGRFASLPSENGYYPVAMRAHWPLSGLPSEDEFLAALGEEG